MPMRAPFNGIAIGNKRSIIDDGNLHTWLMLHISLIRRSFRV